MSTEKIVFNFCEIYPEGVTPTVLIGVQFSDSIPDRSIRE